MKPAKSLALPLALLLAACGTVNSGRAPAASVTARLDTRVAPTTTASIPTTLPTYTLVLTQKSQPTPSPLPLTSTPPLLPTATPTSIATIKPSPSQPPSPASSSSGPEYDWNSPYKLPTPAFFFKSAEGNVYFLEGIERHLVDGETFLNLGYQENDIVGGSSMEMSYPEGVPLTRLIKGSGDEVYWLENGFRRHIPDMETFRQLGYRPEDIFQVSDNLLRTWPLGEPLPSILGTPPEPTPEGATPSQERVVLLYRPLDRHARASELYIVYADGRNPRRLSHTTGYTYHTDAAWSPDGQSVAFAQCLANMPNSTGCEIAMTSPDRWAPRPLAKDVLMRDPVWSPDGTQLAFTQGSMGSTIVVMNIDGDNIQPTTVESWKFAWTPDGRIAFWTTEREAPEKSRLMIMDADGQNVQPVEAKVTVFDQRYSPWRQGAWVANGSPDYPAGR